MANGESPSQLIDARIEELGDWRGETLARVRGTHQGSRPRRRRGVEVGEGTSPGTPVWSHDGIICTGETYKSVVKMTFAKGASLEDPVGPLQLQPRGQHEARHRLPRGRRDRRGGAEGAHSRRRGPEHRLAPLLEPLAAQALRGRHLLAVRTVALRTRVSIRAGRSSNRGSERNMRRPLRPSSPFAEVGVVVAVGAERDLRVVHVDAAKALEPDLGVEARRRTPRELASARRISKPDASRWQESRQAPEPLAAAGRRR